MPIVFVIWGFTAPKDIWEILKDAKLEARFNVKTESFDMKFVPSEELKKLDGKIITIKGFIYEDRSYGLVLSRYSELFRSCTFPIEERAIRIKKKYRNMVDSEQPQTLQGRFELNTTQVGLPYILHDIKCLDCEE